MHVFFFRGLSTYGTDHAQIAFLKFGSVFRHFQREFTKQEINFYPVTGIGVGSLNEMSARAGEYVRKHPAFSSPEPIHFLGHSAGGLIARILTDELADLPEGKLRTCLTIASPHQGSGLAEVCLKMGENYRNTARFLSGIGYKLENNHHIFKEFTPQNVRTFFSQPARTKHTKMASIVCWAPREEWCRPLKFAYKLKPLNDFTVPSDGLVERDTQPFGDVLAELKIDHLRQAGFCGENHRFENMCKIAGEFIKAENRRF